MEGAARHDAARRDPRPLAGWIRTCSYSPLVPAWRRWRVLLLDPLTFNDPLAREYGQDRFGWGESFHSTLASRFGLLRRRAWFRRRTQVETEFAIAFSAIHALTLERARRQSKTTAQPARTGHRTSPKPLRANFEAPRPKRRGLSGKVRPFGSATALLCCYGPRRASNDRSSPPGGGTGTRFSGWFSGPRHLVARAEARLSSRASPPCETIST